MFRLPIPVLALTLTASFLCAQVSQQNGIAERAEDAKPIQNGPVPNGPLKTLEGRDTTLHQVLGGKAAVLIFYRGGWCPFCVRHLSELSQVLPDIKKLGVQLVAISPDLPSELAKAGDKSKLEYGLFSDSGVELAKKFGLAFRVDDATFERYKGFGIDLEKSSGQNHHVLPVPAVYVVDAKGQIQFVHTDPDYRKRLKGSVILEAAKKATAP
jgi:peroxiredoxin